MTVLHLIIAVLTGLMVLKIFWQFSIPFWIKPGRSVSLFPPSELLFQGLAVWLAVYSPVTIAGFRLWVVILVGGLALNVLSYIWLIFIAGRLLNRWERWGGKKNEEL